MSNVKYPRTYHLSISPGRSSDDKIQHDLSGLVGKEVIVTVKMDGENATMTRERCYARSVDSKHHPSRSWIKSLHSTIKNDIPENFRLCGENMFAKHSIFYEDLDSYFLLFSVWDGDICLSWDETLWFAKELGISTVPVVYRCFFDLDLIMDKFYEFCRGTMQGHEGFVIRLAGSFRLSEFSKSVVKYVRENHVQTDKHWMHAKIFVNKLRESNVS